MATQKIKVAVTGATGETGVSIIKALLENEEFVRSSIFKHHIRH